MLHDFSEDLLGDMVKAKYAAEPEAAYKALFDPDNARGFYQRRMAELARWHKDGRIQGPADARLGDLALFDALIKAVRLEPNLLKPYPGLQVWYEAMKETPAAKTYMEKLSKMSIYCTRPDANQ